jgi:outer membrane protein assembly factor BamB
MDVSPVTQIPPARAAVIGSVARGIAVTAAVFTTAVAALLVINFFTLREMQPLDNPVLQKRMTEAFKQPGDKELVDEARAIDLLARRAYFSSIRFRNVGAWLLLIGAGVLAVSLRVSGSVTRPSPFPGPVDGRRPDTSAPVSRWSVAGTGLVLCAAALAAASLATVHQRKPVAVDGQPAPSSFAPRLVAPPDEDWRRNWPCFRGPAGDGRVPDGGPELPVDMDAVKRTNLLWKAPVPLIGASSPVVWGNRVYLTGAEKIAEEVEKPMDSFRREVYCFDADSGALLWTRRAESDAAMPKPYANYCYAGPTPAADGERVYAMFANAEVLAVDAGDGHVVWTRALGVPVNPYGHGASPALRGGRIFIQIDQNSPAGPGRPGPSRLIALDAATGKTLWEQPRPVSSSWTTPIVIMDDGKPRVISTATEWIIACDAETGQEIWRCRNIKPDKPDKQGYSENVEMAPSPIQVGGAVVTAVVGTKLERFLAVRLGGCGDVSDTHVAWEEEKAEDMPSTCSPVSDGKRIYLLSATGFLSCFDVDRGRLLWKQNTEGSFAASPVLAGDRLYLAGDSGKGLVVRVGAEYQELGRIAVPDPVYASPAVAGGRVFIRSTKALYAFGLKPSAIPVPGVKQP